MARRNGFLVAALLILTGLVAMLAWPRESAPDGTTSGPEAPPSEPPPAARVEEAPPVSPADREQIGVCRVDATVVADQRPVPQIPVVFFRPDKPAAQPVTLTTDAGGHAVVTLPPARYGAMANNPNSPGADSDFYFATQEFTARSGDDLELRLELPRLNAALAVSVVDDLGAPIAGVPLSLRLQEPSRLTTDLQGRAVFTRLPPVPVRVEVEPDDTLKRRHAVEYAQAANVTLSAGHTEPLRIVLPRNGAFRVVADRPPGVDARVTLDVQAYAVESDYPHRQIHHAVDLGEAVTVPELPPQVYRVIVQAPTGSGLSVEPLERVTVLAGETVDVHVKLAMHRGRVTGLVIDRDGRPVPGVRLLLFLEGPTPQQPETRNVASATDGSFAFDSVPQRPMRLLVDPATVKAGNYAFFGSLDDPLIEISGPTEGLRVVLEPGFSISGILLDRRSRKPTDRGQVYIQPERTPAASWQYPSTDPKGRFEFRNLRAGEYTVWYDSGTEAEQARQKIRVGPGVDPQSATIELLVHPDR